MAVIKPFRGYFYSSQFIKNHPIEHLAAPPYDVISEKEKARLAEEPYNFVHLTLGKVENSYQKAKERLQDWIKEGVIEQDEAPSFYIDEQEFQLNSGERKKRTGFVALVRLENWEKKIIMPHERTMPKYSLDRLELLRATRANLEQIFGIFNDSSGGIDELLEENKKEENFMFQFTDYQGVTHRLWRIKEKEVIDKIKRILSPRTIIIADGHHRYETSLMYREERRKELQDPWEEIPEDYVMMTLVNMKNPGLLILPTHRLVHNLPEERVKEFFRRCENYFTVKNFANEREMEEFLRSAPLYTIGVYDKVENKWGAITLKDLQVMDEKLGKENVNRYLDTAILHEVVFKEILGINKDGEGESEHVDYLRGTKDVFALAREENYYQLVFVMRATPLERVEEAVTYAQRMPQKSTYFYPKVWSGLVFRLLDEE
ncbi:MAG: hypothetical protein PWP57_387 [Candidatus Atribacteria bacterium]|nr:hypothetical protein [Candidatus Atribacteria bacterium]